MFSCIHSLSSVMATPAPPLSARSFFSSVGSRGFPFSLRLDFTGEISGQSYKLNTRTGIHSIEAKATTRRENRDARHERVRKKVHGTPERPRMCVFRSNKHLYVQVIDDTKMHTLAAASTMQKPVTEEVDFSSGPTIEVAKKVGEAIAKSCLEKGITKVAFDRGGYQYHGRVKALADAARDHGLLF